MLGAVLAALSAASFGLNNAMTRRGVLTGSVGQALAIGVPIGVPMFFLTHKSCIWMPRSEPSDRGLGAHDSD